MTALRTDHAAGDMEAVAQVASALRNTLVGHPFNDGTQQTLCDALCDGLNNHPTDDSAADVYEALQSLARAAIAAMKPSALPQAGEVITWRPNEGLYNAVHNMPVELDGSESVMFLRRDGRQDGPLLACRIEWHHQSVSSDIMFYAVASSPPSSGEIAGMVERLEGAIPSFPYRMEATRRLLSDAAALLTRLSAMPTAIEQARKDAWQEGVDRAIFLADQCDNRGDTGAYIRKHAIRGLGHGGSETP